ncbi:MAG: GNAT family N-acetyltransferase [Candidatus Eremiobacteraeota bacterium]|nr:GNAT family N-acetyltransferase [Candidatus Eremiobacteraeota bacterium]MBV8222099.1 GNAT family N-acetyltransferase [Candidatus Eremiobacteraeota bacterium]
MPPTIETARLTLRSLAQADFEPYYDAVLSQRAVMYWLSASGEPRSREESLATWARLTSPQRDPRDRFWAVVNRASGELLGHVVLQRLDKGDLIEVGYALGEKHWGAGFATEASRAVVEFGFATTDLEMIVGIARPNNGASRRVLEKTGLQYAGMRRYYDVDVAYYELHRAAHEAALTAQGQASKR